MQQDSETIETRSSNTFDTNARDGLTQQTSEGTRFLQSELESNPLLGTNKSKLLREAIDFVSRISDTSKPYFATDAFNPSETAGGFESTTFPPELLYMMTMDPEPNTMKQSFWPDHVSFPTLEEMCMSLIDGDKDQHTLTCYRVCVFMKAAGFLYRLPKKDRKASLRRHLERSKKQYEHEIHKGLSEIDCLAPPSLVLLQAFLSGALFMQNQGDMSRSWTLTAFASRTLVSLNYHSIDSITLFDETKRDIYGSLYTCYYLDKMLSVLLLRPPSLPKLKIKPVELVQLDPRLPLSATVKIMVGFAQIQEGVLDILNHTNNNDQVTFLTKLTRDTHEIYELMKKHQNQLPFRGATYEWGAIEFGYYAILASVLHLHQRVSQDRSTQQDCLEASRQALTRLVKLQDEIYMDANFLDQYPYFLTWTLLFYPLSPFFVLFCNAICSANLDDYTLMAEVTHGVSRFVKMHLSISDVYRLFSAFLGIVRPLIHSRPDPLLFQPTPSALTQGNTSSNMTNMATQYPTARMDHTIGSNLDQEGTTDLPDQAVGGQDGQIVPGDEDLWDLIDSQPWLGWMRSDALTENPTSS
ncbi:unnamed protein product [Penicillium salamii]|uniref:Transcription factor domain-containing protein n=1 Tax=Penicillium salamii TaxID=1612424 RepID=A0A9W4J2W0_9EURO|nr:unnamed protein product [Penicillium salamii]CAG8188326.1 unnamed protein product [Penicillium salamii]CAG8263043.1 unnamed protein product [Penicillium salamii]CAG8313108.1 unnamed protein product [Penicillium salamii]CAG8370782.1 unnamed protein product [Penicillium salamii]